MAVSSKVIEVGSTEVCDATLIYSRVLGLQPSREITFSDVLKHELAPILTSMFDDKGEMRIAKSYEKTTRRRDLCPIRHNTPPPDTTIVDGSAVLWVLHWPNKATMQDYISNLYYFILEKAKHSDVYRTLYSTVTKTSASKAAVDWPKPGSMPADDTS